jgi:hypothetical protein
VKSTLVAHDADSERLLPKLPKDAAVSLQFGRRDLVLSAQSMITTVSRSTMRTIGMLSAVASAFIAIGSAAAADMPASPPPNGYYGPPVEQGYFAPPPPVVAYPPPPIYRYYVPPPVVVVPAPYVRPYYGWGYPRPFYRPWRYAYGYPYRYGY